MEHKVPAKLSRKHASFLGTCILMYAILNFGLYKVVFLQNNSSSSSILKTCESFFTVWYFQFFNFFLFRFLSPKTMYVLKHNFEKKHLSFQSPDIHQSNIILFYINRSRSKPVFLFHCLVKISKILSSRTW